MHGLGTTSSSLGLAQVSQARQCFLDKCHDVQFECIACPQLAKKEISAMDYWSH
jgi:hypothetical protein